MRTKHQDIIVTTIRLPREVKAWLRERADHYCGSASAELVRLCRLAMEAEAEADAKARKSATAAE